ncbi:hypothetical protein H114_00657 [Streptomyces gancidicus BKS 13-15]|uniref:Uncharacterized protein n=1 Tax=Streptomyces gancidicus BKS 13-15 TaxID=1284664 RepID=M3C3Z1_STREZ|nr:hypothetical protein [Streptomyces gancidicus]EMF31094.1 hypothetical protein H114_00657 [Streptomyces gancidicus BKS 13-15]
MSTHLLVDPQPYATTHGKFDLVKLQRVVDGTLPHTELSREEKVYIAQHFAGSARSIGRLLGVTEKTVSRWKEDADKRPGQGEDRPPEQDGDGR